MILKAEHPETLSYLFEGWKETLIWSCLQNVMGEIYVSSAEHPLSAMAILGDFCFFAGVPDCELVQYKPQSCNREFIIMVPQNEDWSVLIEQCYQEKAKRVIRYAIKKEEDIFNRDMLQEVIQPLPEDYEIKMMDEELFYQCREMEWCRDWVSQYDNYEMYQKHGLGVVILKDGFPVSGASSYSGYLSGIEIEIDTKKEYRRQGLAFICGARLILECLARGWYPSWDAQNKWSVALAEKLGYHFDHEYPAYEITGYGK